MGIKPYCFVDDCNNNRHDICIALTDTYFGNKECPFYKSRKDTSAYDMMEYQVTNDELKKRGYH